MVGVIACRYDGGTDVTKWHYSHIICITRSVKSIPPCIEVIYALHPIPLGLRVPPTHTLKHMSQNTTNCCSWFLYVALGCTCSSNDCHFDISIRSHSLSQTSTKQNWHSHDHWHKQQQLIFIDRLKWRCCFCFRFKCTRVETKNNNNKKNKSRSLSSVRVSFFILMVGRSVCLFSHAFDDPRFWELCLLFCFSGYRSRLVTFVIYFPLKTKKNLVLVQSVSQSTRAM